MLSYSVKSDLDRAAKDLGPRLAGQVRFAAALALTRVAQHIKAAQERELRDTFDRPTPYTMRSLFLRSATKANLRARVWLKDDGGRGRAAAHYLYPNIRGGERQLKPFERMLRGAGILPAGMFVVPGEAAKRDGFGNVNRGQLVQILAYLRTFRQAGYAANTTDQGRARLARGSRGRQGFAYFVGRPGDGRLPLGVWQRFTFAAGTAIKPVLIFVDSVHYARIYNFGYVSQRTRERHWAHEFRAALAEAVRTAR